MSTPTPPPPNYREDPCDATLGARVELRYTVVTVVTPCDNDSWREDFTVWESRVTTMRDATVRIDHEVIGATAFDWPAAKAIADTAAVDRLVWSDVVDCGRGAAGAVFSRETEPIIRPASRSELLHTLERNQTDRAKRTLANPLDPSRSRHHTAERRAELDR